MNTEVTYVNGTCIAEVLSDDIVIKKTQDALDIMANCRYQGADRMILHEKNLVPEFFDLKTRIAGDILQKFSNYRMRVAFVGDFSRYQSKSLRDFIYECNKGSQVCFVNTAEEAKARLSGP